MVAPHLTFFCHCQPVRIFIKKYVLHEIHKDPKKQILIKPIILNQTEQYLQLGKCSKT